MQSTVITGNTSTPPTPEERQTPGHSAWPAGVTLSPPDRDEHRSSVRNKVGRNPCDNMDVPPSTQGHCSCTPNVIEGAVTTFKCLGHQQSLVPMITLNKVPELGSDHGTASSATSLQKERERDENQRSAGERAFNCLL